MARVVIVPGLGVRSAATPRDFGDVLRRHGVRTRLIAVDPRRSPHDIGSLGRYGGELAKEPRAPIPFEPLAVDAAVHGLRSVVGERGHPIAAG
jgi:hypothetical protein